MEGIWDFFWSDRGWTHEITPEGHRWRWKSTYREPGKKAQVVDFGLIAGGQYVALRQLAVTAYQLGLEEESES